VIDGVETASLDASGGANDHFGGFHGESLSLEVQIACRPGLAAVRTRGTISTFVPTFEASRKSACPANIPTFSAEKARYRSLRMGLPPRESQRVLTSPNRSPTPGFDPPAGPCLSR
jgi:hypothetical protein